MTDDNYQDNPEIEKAFNEIQAAIIKKIKNIEIINLWEYTFSLAKEKFAGKLSDKRIQDEAWCILSETLDCNNTPEIKPYSEFINENANRLFIGNAQGLLWQFVQSVVPNQTVEQFRQFLINSTINDNTLADFIYDDNQNELSHIVKFIDFDSFDSTQIGYAEYLQKLSVFMSHVSDNKVIKPAWIDFVLYKISELDDLENEVHKSLIDALANYFDILVKLKLFNEKHWSKDHKELLVKFGILQVEQTYTISSIDESALHKSKRDSLVQMIDEFAVKCSLMPSFEPVRQLKAQLLDLGYDNQSESDILQHHIKDTRHNDWVVIDNHNIELKDFFIDIDNVFENQSIELLKEKIAGTGFEYLHSQSVQITYNGEIDHDDGVEELCLKKISQLQKALPNYDISYDVDTIFIKSQNLQNVPIVDNYKIKTISESTELTNAFSEIF
jgi:hypothetical protein